MRNLPLVIPNHAELERSAHVFLQGKNLPKSPLHCERLPGVMLVPLFCSWISQLMGKFALVPLQNCSACP
jgi:hypothetical protein